MEAADGALSPAGTGRCYLTAADRSWLSGDPLAVAARLLGLLLVAGPVSGRIVEVEAYRGSQDPASHAFRGRSARNATMFGRPGLLYVYFTYGMHHCCNVVCSPENSAGAVLVRALEPIEGEETMAARRMAGSKGRGARARRATEALPEPGALTLPAGELCSGPAKLCQALGIDRSLDGSDLLDPVSPVRLAADSRSAEYRSPQGVVTSPRVGIDASLVTAAEPWRLYVEASAHVSGRRRRQEPSRETGSRGAAASPARR